MAVGERPRSVTKKFLPENALLYSSRKSRRIRRGETEREREREREREIQREREGQSYHKLETSYTKGVGRVIVTQGMLAVCTC